MSDIQRRHQPLIVAPDINVTGERAGAAHRQVAIRHVKAQLTAGFLDGDEAGRRVNFLGKAVTKAEVASVLQDLPPLPEPVNPWFTWSNRYVYVPALTALISAFASAGTAGGLVISGAQPSPSIAAYFLGVPLLTFGIIFFFVTLLAMCCKLDG